MKPPIKESAFVRRLSRTLVRPLLLLGLLLGLAISCARLAPRSYVRPTGAVTASATPASLVFAAGACQRFLPTHGDQHRTIFVDPGHGGPDPGTSGSGPQSATVDEKTATLAVALDLLPLLRAQGYTVVLARTGDTPVKQIDVADLQRGIYTAPGVYHDLLARIACANQNKADLLLAIHFNGFDDPTVGGAQTYYDTARPFAAENERFATLVQQNVLASLAAAGWQIPDRGISDDASDDAPTLAAQAANYHYLLELGPAQADWLTTPSTMPGVLCEVLFLTDPYEVPIAATQAGQQAIAQGFDQAIAGYFAQVKGSGRWLRRHAGQRDRQQAREWRKQAEEGEHRQDADTVGHEAHRNHAEAAQADAEAEHQAGGHAHVAAQQLLPHDCQHVPARQ